MGSKGGSSSQSTMQQTQNQYGSRTPTLSDASAVLLAARGAICESLKTVLLKTLSYHDCAPIERLNCMQFGGRLHKRNPPVSAVIRDILDIQGRSGWHLACMHFHP